MFQECAGYLSRRTNLLARIKLTDNPLSRGANQRHILTTRSSGSEVSRVATLTKNRKGSGSPGFPGIHSIVESRGSPDFAQF